MAALSTRFFEHGNDIPKPLVPNRPARPTRCKYESASAGASCPSARYHPEKQNTHIVDDNVNSLDIDTTSKDVGSNQDSLLEVLEHLVSVDSAIVSIKFEHSYHDAWP